MLKLGSIALGTVLLFSGMITFSQQNTENKEEIYYQDTEEISYVNTEVGSGTTASMTINYSNRNSTIHSLALTYPTYCYSPAIGSCAAIAGGNVIGFFDRYDENLIPNHSSGRPIANTYMYSSEDSAVHAVICELYEYMGTTMSGTTEKQFKDGMTAFCAAKGRSITFSSCMQGGSLNYSTAKNYLDANQPIILFLSSYNVINMVEKNNQDSLSIYVSDTPHIMISFGYKSYIYDGTTTYNYFSVASGIIGQSNGLYNINYKTKINNALAVNIS